MDNAMYADDDLLPISALQHLLYCERQCALIHVEGQWGENRLTAEGRVMHDRADEPVHETRGDTRICRALDVRSSRLGLIGRCDVVEFRSGVPLPVEYKRGEPKAGDCDRVQLCSQAICLEETLGVAVPCGALFYGQTRHRFDVAFDSTLRCRTESTAQRLHALIAAGVTPPPVNDARCSNCSLFDICMPGLPAGQPVHNYLQRIIDDSNSPTAETDRADTHP